MWKPIHLREAANILGFDNGKENILMQTGMDNNDIMNSALALAKKKQSEPDDWEQFAVDHPATVKYLEKQKNMAISYDDVKPLGRLEDTINSAKDHLELAELEEQRAQLGIQLRSMGLGYTDLSADQKVQLQEINDKIERISKRYQNDDMKWYNPFSWDIFTLVGSAAGMANDVLAGAQTALVGAATGAAVGFAAGGAGAIPGAITGAGWGFLVGMAASMGNRAGGNSYIDNITRKSADGTYMDASSAATASILNQAGNTAIGIGGISRLLSRMPGGQKVYEAFTKAVPDNMLASPELTQSAWKVFARNLALNTAEQSVIFGAGVEALNIASEKTAQELSGLTFDESNQPGAAERIWNATTQFVPQALVLSGATGAVGSGVNHLIKSRVKGATGEPAKLPTPTGDYIDKLGGVIDETKTSARSKTALEEYIAETTAGSKMESVGVPASEWVRYWQSVEGNPEAEAAKFGVKPEDLQLALQTGSDISIKLSAFFKEYHGTAHEQGLKNDIRVGAFTDNEIARAVEEYKQYYEQVQELVNETKADIDDPAYKTAVDKTAEVLRQQNPEVSDSYIKAQALMVYAPYKQMERRGILKILGYKDANEALQDLGVMYREAPAQAGEGLNMSIQPENKPYIRTREDGIDYGRLGDVQSESALEKAPVRLQIGFHIGGEQSLRGAGAAHIQKHSKALRDVGGYENLQDAITDVLSNYEKGTVIAAKKEGGSNRVHLARKSPLNNDRWIVMTLDLMKDDEKGGNYYSVISITPRPTSQVDKMLKKGTSFSGRSTPSTDSGIGATGAPVAGKAGSSGVLRPSKESSFSTYSIDEARQKINEFIYTDSEGKRLNSDILLQKVEDSIENPLFDKVSDGKVAGSYLPRKTGKAIVELYKNANAATLSHEMMHHVVDLYQTAIKTGKASEEVVKDFETLNKFVGAKDGEAWTESQHEKVTSAYETYLSEGKAPSAELMNVFEKFKTWMKRIYKKIIRQPIEINDDVRQVFDRMLASDEQIAGVTMIVDSERGSIGNLTELKEYAHVLEQAHKEAGRIMTKRYMAELKPEFKAMERAKRAEVREATIAQMQKEPEYAARFLMSAPAKEKDVKAAMEAGRKKMLDDAVRQLVLSSSDEAWYRDMLERHNGKMPVAWAKYIDKAKAGDTSAKMPKKMREEYEAIAEDVLSDNEEYLNLKMGNSDIATIVESGGGLKLDRQSVVKQFGEEYANSLPKRWFAKEGKPGWGFDDVADFVGLSSGDELRQRITNSKDFASELKSRVDEQMSQWRADELGDIKAVAMEAMSNTHSLEAMGIEAAALLRLKEERDNNLAERMAVGREKTEQQREVRTKQQREVSDAADKAADKATAKAVRETRREAANVQRGLLKAKAARDVAKEAISNQEVGNLNWQKMLQNAVKADRQSTQAYRRGDVDQAIIFKDQAMLARAMAKEAVKAQKEYEKGLKFFKKIEKRGLDEKHIDHAFNVQVDQLASQFGLLNREPLKPLDGSPTPTLREFLDGYDTRNEANETVHVDGVRDSYFTPDIPPAIMEMVDNANRNGVAPGTPTPKHYTHLTFNEFRDLQAAVKSIQEVGKLKDKPLSILEKVSIAEAQQKLAEQINTHKEHYQVGEMGQEQVGLKEKVRRWFLDDPVEERVKMEYFCRIIDKGEEQGFAVRYLLNPILDGLTRVEDRQQKAVRDLQKTIKDAGWTEKEIAALDEKKHHFDFMKNDLTEKEIFTAALNMGNESNRDRLRYYFETPEQRGKKKLSEQDLAEIDGKMMQVVGVLEERHWKLIQGIWDYLGTYAEDIRRHEIECSGSDVRMIEPTAFKVFTKDGKAVEMKGGYYPVAYDPGKDIVTMNQAEANRLFKENPTVQASTAHGWTNTRTAHQSRPLLLDWSVLTNHLQNIIYDLEMRKPIIDVSRILSNADVRMAMETRFGQGAYRMSQDWLRSIAADQREQLSGSEKLLRWGRTRMSLAMLGFRPKALFFDAQQNMMTAIWQMGGVEFLRSVSEFYLSDPTKMAERIRFVNERSTMMRNKTSFMDQSLQDFRNNTFENGKFMGIVNKNSLVKAAFACDMVADSMWTYPAWMHVYGQCTKAGMSEAEAITRADSMGRRLTLDASKAGMAGEQRTGEAGKLIRPFYSYFSAQFNRLWFDLKLAEVKLNDGQPLDAVRLFTGMILMGVTLPALWEGFMTYQLNNDRRKDQQKVEDARMKSAITATLTYPLSSVMNPLASGVARYSIDKAVGNYANYELSPVESYITKVGDEAYYISKYIDNTSNNPNAGRKLLTNTADIGAMTFGVPMRFTSIASNMWDYANNGGDIRLADFISRRRNPK